MKNLGIHLLEIVIGSISAMVWIQVFLAVAGIINFGFLGLILYALMPAYVLSRAVQRFTQHKPNAPYRLTYAISFFSAATLFICVVIAIANSISSAQ